MKVWQAICVGVIIGFPGGVATMQATIIGSTRENTVKIEQLSTRLDRTEAAFEKRMDRVIQLWESSLESNRALITLVEKQIALLEDRKP